MQWVQRPTIRFKFAPEKAKEAVSWMLTRANRLDLHTILKSFYFADKEHLNKYGRPIFGAVYRAMKFGPVPLEVYEMLKGDPIWLAELDVESLPWRLIGYSVNLEGNDHEDRNVFSETDFQCLQDGYSKSSSMSFNARTAATHGPDWQKANLGLMRYEDMLEDTPDKDEIIARLRESAPFMRL